MKLNTTFLLLFFAINILSQQIILCDDVSNLSKLDIQSCETEIIFDPQNEYYDIAFHPNGKIYGIKFNGDLVEFDTSNGTVEIIHTFSQNSLNSLTISSDGKAYVTGALGNIFLYNIAGGIEINLGTTSFSATGDLAFYNGGLYMASSDDKIILIDINDVENSTVAIDVDVPGQIYGLATLANDCNEKELYAITSNFIGPAGEYSTLYKVDFTTNSFEYICGLTEKINGSGGEQEFLASSPLQILGIDTTKADCELSNGTLTIFYSGGFGNITYSINGIDFESENVFSNLAAGIYTISIMDESGCVKTQTVELECHDLINAISSLSKAET